MAGNWIDVCNMALALIGGQSINSLDEPTPEARNCKRFLRQTRQSVLAAHAWNCATQWFSPPLLGRSGQEGCPLWPYAYAFALPGDCLRVLRLEGGPSGLSGPFGPSGLSGPFGPSGSFGHTGRADASPLFMLARHGGQRVLLCDLPRPNLVYVGDVEKPDLLGGKLHEAIVCLLASRLALPLAESPERARFFLEQYRETLQEALLIDAREGCESLPPGDSWLREREAGRGFDPVCGGRGL